MVPYGFRNHFCIIMFWSIWILVMRKSARIKAQTWIDENEVHEMALTKREVVALLDLLMNYVETMDETRDCLTLHYLPLKYRMQSALFPKILIKRMSSLLHIEVTGLTAATQPINLDDELQRIAEWLDLCDN